MLIIKNINENLLIKNTKFVNSLLIPFLTNKKNN